MSLSVNFKNNNGILSNRKFEKNIGISVYGKLTGVTGIFEPATLTRLEITENGKPYYLKETYTNVFGDYNFYFKTPDRDTKLLLKLVGTYSISGQDTVLIPVGVGNVNPDELPNPETKSTILEYLPMVFIALFVLAVGYLILNFKKEGVF